MTPKLREITHNAWIVLQTVSRTRLEAALADEVFQQRLAGIFDQEQA